MSVVFFFLPMLLAVTFTGFTYLWAGFAGGLIVGFLIYRFYPKFYWKMIERNLRKFLRKGGPTAPWKMPAAISLEDDGLHFSIGSKESVSPYSSIQDIVHENDAVYIYVDALQGSIIPAGVHGTDEFVAALKAKLPSHS
ncbi:MAG TPA: YcxB family protein [Methanocorpusculum sp.]|nr:YcxB family protein [Methanocorpusculum sp.]HKL97091.1 YcxB family protein [Methanocorpusculum sp.]